MRSQPVASLLMPIEQLTYADLADRLKCSPEAARSLTKRLRLPRQRGNNGKTLVAVDLSEVRHKPMPARSPGGHRPDTEQLVGYAAALKAEISELEDEVAQLAISASGHRADYEHERDRGDGLMAELLRQAADLMHAKADLMIAKEAGARLEGELAVLRSRPWWQRLAG
jgi:nucleotide-binding universal stress UspA family protein